MIFDGRKYWWLVAVLALVVGFVAGAYVGNRSALATAWAHAVAYDRQLQTEAVRLYKSANPDEARHTLAAHLGYLETMEPRADVWRPGQHPWLDSTTLAFDRMLAAGRLALIEERASATRSAESLWLTAARYAQEAGQPDPSRAAIERTIRRLDENADKTGGR